MLASTNVLSRRVPWPHNSLLRMKHGLTTKGRGASITSKAGQKQDPNELQPERLERYMQLMDSGRLGFDPWAASTPLLDLHVPTRFAALPTNLNLRDRLKFLRYGLENRISNISSMFRIARNRSFPWNSEARPYSLQVFKTSSTKPGTWIEPLRDLALDSYRRINKAVAENDVNTIRFLTDGAYKKHMLARMKALHAGTSSKKAPSRAMHIWRLHSLASPVRCVSIRSQQGHFGRAAPAFGTRLVVQACMRFDTWQSLATVSPSGSSEPEPKRVLEYLVYEKKMWYDEPWVARDQLWEGLLAKPKALG